MTQRYGHHLESERAAQRLLSTRHPPEGAARRQSIVSVDSSTEPDQLAVLRTIVARLDDVSVPYMVTGSMALNFYAMPRMTRDIDIVVELDAVSGQTLGAALTTEFYVDHDAIQRAVAEQRIVNVIHLDRLVKVDLIVRKNTDFARTEFSRRSRHDQAWRLWLVSPEDLVLSKLLWAQQTGSELQLRDVREIIRAVEGLDRDYLERWVQLLGVSEGATRAGAL